MTQMYERRVRHFQMPVFRIVHIQESVNRIFVLGIHRDPRSYASLLDTLFTFHLDVSWSVGDTLQLIAFDHDPSVFYAPARNLSLVKKVRAELTSKIAASCFLHVVRSMYASDIQSVRFKGSRVISSRDFSLQFCSLNSTRVTLYY